MILNAHEKMIAKRYLVPVKGERFVFVVAGFSIIAVALGVAAHRIDAVERRVACLVLFAGEDDLAVAGQQIEVELAIADLLQMELAGRHGDTSCAVCLPTSVGRFAHGCVSSVAAGHGGPNVVRWGRSTVGWTTFSLPAIAPARRAWPAAPRSALVDR